MSPTSPMRAAGQLFSRRQRPTSVVVSSDVQAIGVISASAALRLRIPEDLAVVSVDGTRAVAFANPAITTLSQPIEHMARRAVATIVARGIEPVHAVICGSLTIRRSCGCRTEAAVTLGHPRVRATGAG